MPGTALHMSQSGRSWKPCPNDRKAHMRILQITRSIDPAAGGPTEAVNQFNSYCIGTGHTVEIASLDDPDSTPPASHDVPIRSLGPAALKYGYSRHFAPWL